MKNIQIITGSINTISHFTGWGTSGKLFGMITKLFSYYAYGTLSTSRQRSVDIA